MHSDDKPCRACFDFRTWMRKVADAANKATKDSRLAAEPQTEAASTSWEKECPLDKDTLGKSTWSFLHTMAAYLPDKKLTADAQRDMKEFMRLLALYYPCEYCAEDLKKHLAKHPVDTSSNDAFAQWLCRLHNEVNKKLGKPQFDCRYVNERWRDGWKDGSCG